MTENSKEFLENIKTALERGHEVIINKLSYLERHNNSGFKVGDYVRVKRMPESYEDGWALPFCSALTKFIGKSHKIVGDEGIDGFKFLCKEFETPYYFPFFCLENAEPIKVSMKEIAEKLGIPEELILIEG